ncbi:FMN-binding protein [Sediminispirochaeta smaragdinae]|uniref:Uncharacterized protein n=1 Tax=Sediminispirochaeta smaragdinae (strain DSM 11293 / JCM 15392 / SEBR 4228) TaxID=573413 RepID=E1R5Y8_SEDSS|nr:FMN-binding protein [Sediminispirochaeta smaragdinae]ADK80753.1 hypothetical protein Spirs_1626 [Sediminispirochaeta smaragdinae DSM 11293]
MKRKILLISSIMLLALSVGLFAQQSTRSDADFVKQAMTSFQLDAVRPAYIEADRMEANYHFYPAVKGGRVVGYLWWARDFRIANHFEDIILLVKADGQKAKLVDFWISHNDHHMNMSEPATKEQYAGMAYDSSIDTVSGSTLSSMQVTTAAKTTLFVFEKYVIEKDLLK